MGGIGFGIGISSQGWRLKGGAASAAPEFIISVKTDNAGLTASNQFKIPLPAGTGKTYNYDVDWGDGNTDTGLSVSTTHTYVSAGTYTIKISGDFYGIQFNLSNDDTKLIDIQNWGVVPWVNVSAAFRGCSNLTTISATDSPNFTTEGVTLLTTWFANCVNLNSSFEEWDFSGILGVANFLYDCDSYRESLASWQVTQMTDLTMLTAATGLSTSNYDATLIAWDAQGAMSATSANFGGSKYTGGGAAEAARTSLITKWGAIVDGGVAP